MPWQSPLLSWDSGLPPLKLQLLYCGVVADLRLRGEIRGKFEVVAEIAGHRNETFIARMETFV